MNADDRVFLKEFLGALTLYPLDPDDPRYVPLYEAPGRPLGDPVELLATAIECTPGESVQLLSGFKGTGKSTELRRLRSRLRRDYAVVLCDLEPYLNLSTPMDVSDFLLGVAGAFGDALVAEGLVDDDPAGESYWSRFVSFLTRTRVEWEELTGGFAAGDLSLSVKANLKNDPTFKQRLQGHMAGRLGALVADVRSYVEECVKAVRKRRGGEAEMVVILDSVDHVRGSSVNAEKVQASLENLFASHADKLHLPYLHLVYTVPPYLKVRYPNLGSLYAPGGVLTLPAVKLHDEHDGSIDQRGLDALERVVRRRGDWERLLGDRSQLDRIILQSGGHLRDLMQLLFEVVRRARAAGHLPADEAIVSAAISQLQTEFGPIARADALWLDRIRRTHRASLERLERLPDLARFLDTHMVVCYRNDSEWYDVHPLIAEEVAAQAREEQGQPPGDEAPSSPGGTG